MTIIISHSMMLSMRWLVYLYLKCTLYNNIAMNMNILYRYWLVFRATCQIVIPRKTMLPEPPVNIYFIILNIPIGFDNFTSVLSCILRYNKIGLIHGPVTQWHIAETYADVYELSATRWCTLRQVRDTLDINSIRLQHAVARCCTQRPSSCLSMFKILSFL